MTRPIVVLTAALLALSSARAGAADLSATLFPARPLLDAWRMAGVSCTDDEAVVVVSAWQFRTSPILPQHDPEHDPQYDNVQPLHPAAIEHSDAYRMRAKIHKVASVATLPLFAAEVALGQSLYNAPANAGGQRAAHAFIGAGIVGLFGVNTVTGAWNLFGEGRTDRDGRTLRLVHGLLMMAADVGFLATTASGPNGGSRRGALTFETDRVTHRNLAIASISVGTAGYLLMLFGNH